MNSAFDFSYDASTVQASNFADLFDVVGDWIEALHGNFSLADAFAELVRGLGASAGILVRTHLNEMRPVRLLTFDAGSCKTSRPLTTSFADGCFGAVLRQTKASTVWIASAHSDRENGYTCEQLDDWQTARGFSEFSVLVLAGGPTTRDHIELHYRIAPSATLQAALGAILPTIARAWSTRRPGLVTDLSERRNRLDQAHARSSTPRALLSVTNPCRLSRAEFRVCLLLSRGLSGAGVAAELGLSEATVRSHLRSIYAKTDSSSLAELVFRLLATPERQVPGLDACA